MAWLAVLQVKESGSTEANAPKTLYWFPHQNGQGATPHLQIGGRAMGASVWGPR